MNESTDFPSPEQPPAEHAWIRAAPGATPPRADGAEIPSAGAVPLEAEPPAGAVPPLPPGGDAPPDGLIPPGGAVPPGGDVPPGGGGYGYYGQPPWGSQPVAARLRRHRTRPAVAAALAVATLAGSALVTHELWPNPTGTPAAASGPSSSGQPDSGQPQTPFGGSFPGFPGSSGSSGSAGDGGPSGTPSSSNEGTGGPANVSSIAANVGPAVVIIDATFRYQQAQGAGTGIVLTSDGEVLTNNHVINGATSIRVTDVGSGRTYTARVAGYDASKDVAVLHLVGASGLKTASIATRAVNVGTPVVAIGNAGGTGSLTPAGGSITGTNKSITASDELDGVSENLVGLLETNANVQSGDSGGPLVDAAGEVVGMDTAASQGFSLQSRYSGSDGYAIPINDALAVARSIEAGQSSSTIHVGPTAFLGVLISSGNLGAEGFQSYGSPGPSPAGAQIAGVVPGGSAANAGLVPGDTITAFDGQSVSSASDVSRIVSGLRPGQKVQLAYTDSTGATQTVDVTLQSGPPA